MSEDKKLWDNGEFTGSKDKAKKVLAVLTDRILELEDDLIFLRQRRTKLLSIIDKE